MIIYTNNQPISTKPLKFNPGLYIVQEFDYPLVLAVIIGDKVTILNPNTPLVCSLNYFNDRYRVIKEVTEVDMESFK